MPELLIVLAGCWLPLFVRLLAICDSQKHPLQWNAFSTASAEHRQE
jgi:hypothetical protein